MARKDSENQKKSMSVLFRGKAIFKPLNTGWIDEHVACVREWIANIFFYTKNGVTIMIDAGYNYERLREKMGWLDINPALIKHILITHQDTDHVGALELDSELLFRDATVYLSEIENRYLTGETRRKVFHGLYKLPMVKTDNPRVLLKDGQIITIGDIKIECILVPGHTWGHMVYLIDDTYLFTGDTIWFGEDGGYSFISTLAEDNSLAVQSLAYLEKNIRERNHRIVVITGHTGWTDDLDFVFAHREEICEPFTKRYTDSAAPYDGYEESDDNEQNARSVLLEKKDETLLQNNVKPDYGNWMPKAMVNGSALGATALGAAGTAVLKMKSLENSTVRKLMGATLLTGAVGAAAFAVYGKAARDAFSYEGESKVSQRIIEGTAKYANIPKDGIGLDIGCGSGALAIAVAKRNSAASMVGCDIWSGAYKNIFSKKICEKNAKAEGAYNVRFEEANAVKLPFANESFDFVTSNYVYHNIVGYDKQALLLETLRVLKKGGTFAIHDLMSKTRYGDMEAFVQKLKEMGYEEVRLIDTTNGLFMDRKEAVLLGLGGSKLLTGRK